jgi:feruloyl esterase
MDKCDALDGLKDGLIDDPRKCRFDPLRDVPACSGGADGADCLTAAQAATVAKIHGGPMSNGRPLPVGGFLPGSEAMTPLPGGGSGSGWLNVIVNTKPEGRAADFNLADNTVRYLWHVPPKPEYDTKTFDFDRDLGMQDAWGRLADAKDADLSGFRNRGGKLLMTYGWADAILQPMMGVNYYQNALAVNGPSTPDFFRLFMIPGMAHCSGGVGPDRHDPVTAIINWVEKGQAPDTIVASKVVDGKLTRTRPLCAYPQVARYKGTGSIDDAANFSCVKP